MDHESTNERLSRISTVWTVVRQAHAAPAGEDALRFLVERYGKAVHRYLLAAVRDPHAADDLAQKFALSLLRGELRSAAPERGRFRNYVKVVLFNLVSKYRKKQTAPLPRCPGTAAPADEEADRLFLEGGAISCWRESGGSWPAPIRGVPRCCGCGPSSPGWPRSAWPSGSRRSWESRSRRTPSARAWSGHGPSSPDS